MAQDSPEMAQVLSAATRLLHAPAMSRSFLGNDRVAAHYEQLAGRLPADHPLVPIATFNGLSVRYVQALFSGDAESADAALTEMIRAVGLLTAGHPFRPF